MFDISRLMELFGGGGQQGPMQLGQLGQQSAQMQQPPLGSLGSPIGNITGMFAGQRPQGGLGASLWDFLNMKGPQGQAAGNPQLDQMLQPPQQPPLPMPKPDFTTPGSSTYGQGPGGEHVFMNPATGQPINQSIQMPRMKPQRPEPFRGPNRMRGRDAPQINRRQGINDLPGTAITLLGQPGEGRR